MTKEEFILAVEDWYLTGNEDSITFLGRLYDVVTPPHWISVEDRKPTKDGLYLIYEKRGFVHQALYGIENDMWFDRGLYLIPTHWMPLPEAPLVTDLNKKDLPPVSWQEGNILVEEEGGEE